MPTLIAYSLTSILFTISYFFTLLALLLPNWLLFTAKPFRTTTSYGLFKKCTSLSNRCQVFPSSEYNDCEEKNFCEEWEAAAAAMIISSIVGGLAWLYLISALLGGRAKRERAWKGTTALLLIHAFLQFAAILLIAHLYTTSDRFYYGVKYDVSFVFANVSAAFSVVLAVVLFLNGLLSPPEYTRIS